jgi:hypothetical protein
MKQNSQWGTPFRTIRTRAVQTAAEASTPERAEEDSLSAPTGVPREALTLDPTRATTFRRSKAAEVEDRFGIEGGGD